MTCRHSSSGLRHVPQTKAVVNGSFKKKRKRHSDLVAPSPAASGPAENAQPPILTTSPFGPSKKRHREIQGGARITDSSQSTVKTIPTDRTKNGPGLSVHMQEALLKSSGWQDGRESALGLGLPNSSKDSIALDAIRGVHTASGRLNDKEDIKERRDTGTSTRPETLFESTQEHNLSTRSIGIQTDQTLNHVPPLVSSIKLAEQQKCCRHCRLRTTLSESAPLEGAHLLASVSNQVSDQKGSAGGLPMQRSLLTDEHSDQDASFFDMPEYEVDDTNPTDDEEAGMYLPATGVVCQPVSTPVPKWPNLNHHNQEQSLQAPTMTHHTGCTSNASIHDGAMTAPVPDFVGRGSPSVDEGQSNKSQHVATTPSEISQRLIAKSSTHRISSTPLLSAPWQSKSPQANPNSQRQVSNTTSSGFKPVVEISVTRNNAIKNSNIPTQLNAGEYHSRENASKAGQNGLGVENGWQITDTSKPLDTFVPIATLTSSINRDHQAPTNPSVTNSVLDQVRHASSPPSASAQEVEDRLPSVQQADPILSSLDEHKTGAPMTPVSRVTTFIDNLGSQTSESDLSDGEDANPEQDEVGTQRIHRKTLRQPRQPSSSPEGDEDECDERSISLAIDNMTRSANSEESLATSKSAFVIVPQLPSRMSPSADAKTVVPPSRAMLARDRSTKLFAGHAETSFNQVASLEDYERTDALSTKSAQPQLRPLLPRASTILLDAPLPRSVSRDGDGSDSPQLFHQHQFEDTSKAVRQELAITKAVSYDNQHASQSLDLIDHSCPSTSLAAVPPAKDPAESSNCFQSLSSLEEDQSQPQVTALKGPASQLLHGGSSLQVDELAATQELPGRQVRRFDEFGPSPSPMIQDFDTHSQIDALRSSSVGDDRAQSLTPSTFSDECLERSSNSSESSCECEIHFMLPDALQQVR